MLVHTVPIRHKNHIIFHHNNQHYYANIDNETKLNVFNANLMNIFLEQYEENIGIVRYNDIVNISVLENHDTEITNLPTSLKMLTIMSSMCSYIEFNNCLDIEYISIVKSNISNFPYIRNCTKLKTLILNSSAIRSFNIDYELPDSLNEINLHQNLITNQDFPYDKLLKKLKNKTLKKINLSDNYLVYDHFPEELRIKCNLLRQSTYKFKTINFVNVANVNINNFVHNAMNVVNPANNTPTPNALLSGQNVHLSSINKSVSQSVEVIKNLVKKNKIKIDTLSIDSNSHISYISNILPFLNKKEKIDKNKTSNEIFNILFRNVMHILRNDFVLPTRNTITQLTYKQTFELVWSLLYFKYINNEINISDTADIIITNIKDAYNLCFTGKYNRLINSLVGIVDGVKVGFSESEELQLEFGKLFERLNKDDNDLSQIDVDYLSKKAESFNKAYCDAKEILNYTTDNNVKNAWLDAVLDLAPNPAKFKYKNTEYYKTWDYDVLDLRSKELVGYYDDKTTDVIFLDDISV